jgi:hypothetical protein
VFIVPHVLINLTFESYYKHDASTNVIQQTEYNDVIPAEASHNVNLER